MYRVIPTYICSTVVLMRIPKVHSYSCSRRNGYAYFSGKFSPSLQEAQWTIYFHNSEPPPHHDIVRIGILEAARVSGSESHVSVAIGCVAGEQVEGSLSREENH